MKLRYAALAFVVCVSAACSSDPDPDGDALPGGMGGTVAEGGGGKTTGGVAEGGAGAGGGSSAAGSDGSGAVQPFAGAGGAGGGGDGVGGAASGASGASGAGGAGPNDIRDLMPLSSASTHSATTPMGVHFEAAAAHQLTASETTFLTDATAQPPIPPSTKGLHARSFPVTLYPSGTPAPSDVNQHAIGDCDGDAALAGMAYSSAAFVKARIKDNHNNTYGVAMFDPAGHALDVNVDDEFLASADNTLAAASSKKGAADWATVLEKAVMKYNAVFKIIPDIGGIGSEFLTPMFTGDGDSFAFDRGVLTPAQLRRAVVASLAAGKFVTGGFGIVKTLGKDQTVVAHAYTVLVPANASTMATMRNPWGVSPTGTTYDTSADGVLNIPLAADWAATVDLRIIEPGAAAGAGVTEPYEHELSGDTMTIVRIDDPHAAR